MTAATGDSLSFGYDALKRLNRVTVKNGSSVILNTAYAYRDVSWNRGSAQVEFRNVRLGSDSGMLLEGKKYVYDDVGNLKEIRESTGDFSKLVEYAYDSQNQLTSEAYYKSGEAKAYLTYYYTYDTAGNLLTVSQKEGDTTTLLQTYTYGDAQWHDLLTAVNGQAITYDASGNPLSYGGWSFGWQNGRQLKTASKTSDGKTETLEYAYDADGIRTSKTYTVETFTQVPDYTVTFTADGATVKTMTVEDGYVLKDSDYPAVPTKTGYTGEWVKYTSAVHSNVTVQAKYTAVVAKYTVTFKADNTVVKTMTVKDGYTLKASDYPTVPAKSGYTGEWVKYTTAIHSNVTVQAKYTAVVTKYTVFFKADGFTVKAIQVNDGYVLQDADYPEVPAKVGCNGAWEKYYEQAKRWGWELDGPFEFYDAVKDGGKWDYKLHPDGSEWIPRNGVFSVNGKKMTAEQLGNINYGFTGSVLGFPAPVLRMAGGFVAIKNSGINWEDWWYDFDSKEDAEMIQLGIDMEYLMTITGYSTDEVVDFFWK